MRLENIVKKAVLPLALSLSLTPINSSAQSFLSWGGNTSVVIGGNSEESVNARRWHRGLPYSYFHSPGRVRYNVNTGRGVHISYGQRSSRTLPSYSGSGDEEAFNILRSWGYMPKGEVIVNSYGQHKNVMTVPGRHYMLFDLSNSSLDSNQWSSAGRLGPGGRIIPIESFSVYLSDSKDYGPRRRRSLNLFNQQSGSNPGVYVTTGEGGNIKKVR
jgi:hypothetical protein